MFEGLRRPVRGSHSLLLLHHQGLTAGRRGESPATAEGAGLGGQGVTSAAGAGAERAARGSDRRTGPVVSPERCPVILQRALGVQRVRPVQLAVFTVLQVATRIPVFLLIFFFLVIVQKSADSDRFYVSGVSFPRLWGVSRERFFDGRVQLRPREPALAGKTF